MTQPTRTSRSPRATSELLIVDDDDVLRERMARALSERNFVVTQASDYDAALQAAAQKRFNFVLLDLSLPGRSGLQLLQVLRSQLPRAKIVMLTGYGSIATALDAVRLGATHYLVKPADVDEVLTAFERGGQLPLTPQPPYRAPSLARAEWEHINRVLSDSGGNISEAARRLAIHRRSLQRKLQKYPPNL